MFRATIERRASCISHPPATPHVIFLRPTFTRHPVICTVKPPTSTSLITKPENLVMTISVLGEEIVPTAYQSQCRDVYVVRLLTQCIASHFTGTAITRTTTTTLRLAAAKLQPPLFFIKSMTSCDSTTSDCV